MKDWAMSKLNWANRLNIGTPGEGELVEDRSATKPKIETKKRHAKVFMTIVVDSPHPFSRSYIKYPQLDGSTK